MPRATPGTSTLLLAAALAAALAACGQATTIGAHGQSVVVEVMPPTAQVRPGTSQPFTASVTGAADTGVVWSVREAAGGSVSATGVYAAPATAGVFHVVATSAADAGVSAAAEVTVTATPVVAVAISPTTASVAAGGTQQFAATVTGATNTTKTWSVVEAGGGSVTSGGLYTAPATAGTYHVKATSQADATKSATATVTVTPPVLAGVCQKAGVEAGVSVGGYVSDRYSWWDDACNKRTAALVRNDATDPFGDTGGYLRAYSYVADGATRNISGATNSQWAGWGYMVNHYGSGSSAAISAGTPGTWRTLFAGDYHAVHEFKVTTQPAGGPIDFTIYWVFATGKAHPLVAITHDTSRAGPNKVFADARGPYGNLGFDMISGNGGNVGGVEWGDSMKFVMTSASPFTMNSTWTYNTPNVVPYTNMWSAGVDAEMGEVQSQTWNDHVAGSDYGGGQTAACHGRTSASPGSCALWTSGATMIAQYLWPFQMNNWELQYDGSPTVSKRMAWGQTIGSVGQTSFTAWGKTLSGYPYQSYAVYMVLGKHSSGATAAQVREMEAVSRATLTATTGTVVQDGPGGAGRTDNVAYSPKGWDHVLGAWAVTAAGNRATVQLAPAAGDSLPNPVFRLLGWTGGALPTAVTLDGQALTAGTDYFPSLDAGTGVLWVTVARTVTAAATLAVQ